MAADSARRWNVPGRIAVLCAMAGSCLPAVAQLQAPWDRPASLVPASTVGLNVTLAEHHLACGVSWLGCRADEQRFAASAPGLRSSPWSLQLGIVDLGRAPLRPGNLMAERTQGLNMSIVGRKSLLGSEQFSLYGRLGTTVGGTERALRPAAADGAGAALSFGAGVSLDVTPRLSATFGWDVHDFRLGGSARDPLRATSLGLQYRY